MNLLLTGMKYRWLILPIILICVGLEQGFTQTNWYKYVGNPILEKGEPGSWDDEGILGLSVLYDGETYHMWYHGNNAIGYANSVNGITWEKYEGNPVITTGGSGSWDELHLQMGHVIFDGDIYKMWYDGHGSYGWAIGLATSPDGIHWTKDTLNSPVLTTGETGSWDDFAVWSPHIIKEDGAYKMWYTGHQDRMDIGFYFVRIGYAESFDGITWTKHPDPVLEIGDYTIWGFDLESPGVIFDGDNYDMWYSTINSISNCCNQIEYAVSSDGIHWTRDSLNNPVIESGEEDSWYQSAYHPYVIEMDNLYRMWFNGSGGFGYAEDFSQLVHGSKVSTNEKYVDPTGESIHILGQVINPENHELSAKAFILGDEESILDSIEIVDDGVNDDGEADNGVYGGSWFPSGENNYTVYLKTEDQETGFSRNGIDWSITNRFTSKGPIVFDSLLYSNPDRDTEANPGDRIKYYFKLLNEGVTDTVYDISINVEHISGYTAKYGFGSPGFGNIAPGESIQGNSDYGISFADSCPAPANIPFEVQIICESDTFWTDTFYVFVDTILTAIEDEKNLTPKKFSLNQNYPNPFNPTTMINYQLPITNYVELSIYNLLGQKVATLVDKRQMAGYHQVKWDASEFSSGVYYYRINAGANVAVKKMILLR